MARIRHPAAADPMGSVPSGPPTVADRAQMSREEMSRMADRMAEHTLGQHPSTVAARQKLSKALMACCDSAVKGGDGAAR